VRGVFKKPNSEQCFQKNEILKCEVITNQYTSTEHGQDYMHRLVVSQRILKFGAVRRQSVSMLRLNLRANRHPSAQFLSAQNGFFIYEIRLGATNDGAEWESVVEGEARTHLGGRILDRLWFRGCIQKKLIITNQLLLTATLTISPF